MRNICGIAAVARINLKESNKQYNLGKNFQIMSLRAFVDSIIILHYLVLRK